MLRIKQIAVACAAILCAALIVPASAENRTVDFDQMDFDVHTIVAQAKKDAKTSETAAPKSRRIKDANVAGDQVERRIVVFKKGVSRTRRMSAVRNLGGIPTKDLWLINAVAVLSPKVRMASLDVGLRALGDVLRVEEDYIQNWLSAAPAAMPVGVRPLPPAAVLPRTAAGEEPPRQEEQKTPWGIDRVNAAKAWATTRGDGVKVAVVDTGIDHTHPDLKVQGGYNAIDPEADYKDDNGHGTHVAGTIAAQDNGEGVVGVAPNVLLWGVKVLSASGSGTFADVIEGIQWTVENGMDVANFSLGASRGTPALADAVKAAAEGGVALIAAAGNSGGAVGFPAAYPEAIAIAASNSSDGVAYFSSRGPEVDFIAPGVGIESTYMGGGYRSLSGTSMATPHAVGLAALAIAAQGIHGVEAVREAFKRAATKFPEVPGEQQGHGMIDAGRLVSN